MKNKIINIKVKELFKYGAISLIVSSLFIGCGTTTDSDNEENEGSENDDNQVTQILTAPSSFTNDVFPILKLQCSTCHSGGKGGFTSNTNTNTTYSSMKNKGFLSVLTTGNGGNGHGGGDQLDTTQYSTILNWINTSSATTITVERGPVYDANVTDANGNVAKKIVGTNTYKFANTPTYPVKAVGGWIDVDGDGNKTIGTDVILDIQLSSYSNVITPVTTYIGDFNKNRSKLDKLINDLNTTEAELLKKPSEADYKAIITQNSLYKIMKENNTTQLNDSHFDDINSSYHSLENTYKQSYKYQAKTSKELSEIFEKETMNDLDSNQYINRMDDAEKNEFEALERKNESNKVENDKSNKSDRDND